MIAYNFYPCFCWLACFAASTPLRAAEPEAPSPGPLMIGEVIHFEARGDYRPTPEEAKESALEKARDGLADILRARGIQRFIPPTLDWIERELEVTKYRRQNKAILDEDRQELIQTTVQLQLKPAHLRAFRKMERTSFSAIAVGLLAVVFLASWLYYRLDEWSKGYLTSWLAIAVVVGGSIVGGIWWWLHS